MNDTLREKVLAAFDLTASQREAASVRGRDIVVTAGAGSGKTSTLVARYAALLADGVDLRRVVAVTFSEKAAREMRSRVRKTLSELVAKSANDEERQFWVELNSKMDAARIGTIHSLCAEILRAHPAEAVVDPRFEMYDESLATALRVQVVDDTINRLVGMPEYELLFKVFENRMLTSVLALLLNKRLEAREAFETSVDVNEAIQKGIFSLLQAPEIADCIQELRSMDWRSLSMDAGDNLAARVKELLELWTEAENELAAGNILECARCFYQIRLEKLDLHSGKRGSEVKEILKSLQAAYDEILNPIFGGKPAANTPPDVETEAKFIKTLELLRSAFFLMTASYKETLRQFGSLDFDDLEQGAADLLRNPAVREIWQGQIDALLVDEFQDTNQRQRDIIEALSGSAGRLFVVGDAKQSIYRFRRADVTVFRSIRQSIRRQGGLPVDLNITFRAHGPLLAGINDMLAEIMGEKEDSSRPYYEPFSPLIPRRETARSGIAEPFVEFVLGYGDDADTARLSSARALAIRLLELKGQGQIKDWDDITLLFRASTGFPYYENAFEEANIPFVTVAGQGFYDRPEIRDVLNILRALADPTDNLAMAGLLRSPAFGLTDGALYHLRWKEQAAVDYWTALNGDLALLSGADQVRAERVVSILDTLMPQVDRIPVAELLQKMVNATDYRALLAIEDQQGVGGRLWRNLDKLINDAQSSGKINIRDFLDYLKTINDAGAREGEAPAEAQGTVRLMTIHKSKGLQFPFVVLADASRRPGGRSQGAYLLQELGLAVKTDPEGLPFRLARVLDKKQSQVEDQRILYVALTRAQEKLIINGHVTPSEKQGWLPSAWLKELTLAANVDVNELIDQAGKAVLVHTTSGQPVRGWAPMPESGLENAEISRDVPLVEEPGVLPIYAPILDQLEQITFDDREDQRRPWHVTVGTSTGSSAHVPANVTGEMVHKALELWLFPGNPQLPNLLETAALNAGLALKAQREAALHEVVQVLSRFQAHPLRLEIEQADQVFHEVPFSRQVGSRTETGYIDLIYRANDRWEILDFKTDAIHSPGYRKSLVEKYSRQMHRYLNVAGTYLGGPMQVRLCFLDDHGRVSLVTV